MRRTPLSTLHGRRPGHCVCSRLAVQKEQYVMRGWGVAAGLLLAAAVAQAQIVIGQTAGFSGPVAAGVKETADGAKLWIDAVNEKGGIHGQKIELVSMDDGFEPKRAAENARKLVEERKVLALFLTRGTPHNEAILPVVEASGVPLIGPSTGAMVLHQPVRRTVFNVRSTYQREAEKALDHLVHLGLNRIAVVRADDSFGEDVAQGIARGLERAKIKAAVDIKADRAKPDFPKIVQAIVKSEAQAVMWIASGTSVTDGVKALRAAGSAAQVVTLSNNASSGFVKALGEHSPGVIITQVFPYERSMRSPFVREAMDLAKERGIEQVSPAMLEGFAAAKVLVEGLRRAGPRPTRAGLLAALEGIRNLDIGGLDLSYSGNDRTGLEYADLSIIGKDGRFRR
jgi:ABC-type branched-subunit amino acid transport system substrate-binding protein